MRTLNPVESHARVNLSISIPEVTYRDVMDAHECANDLHAHSLPEAEFAPQDAEACLAHRTPFTCQARPVKEKVQ